MKRFAKVLAIVLFIAATIFPRPAAALPISWRGTETVTQSGVTYRVRNRDRAAVVVRVHKSRATIPATVKVSGKTYRVRNIWPGALKSCKTLTIRGDLRDGCEDGRLWKIPVRATNPGVYKWLKSTGAHVTR